ncbi:hypothetical protein [Marinobacter fonticola]|uniref:hypothetical protein n=1 Tax=Marinobacter fonticola TaxID=2603215 RepID=UPI0011E8959A|nr:hypothetical protein [Marinobacter fonticola]
MPAALESLDRLLDDFRHALSLDDLDEINRVNDAVRPTIQAAVAEVRDGAVEAGALEERLTDLQALTEQASQGAFKARDEAARGLRDINQNRHAANAYANVKNRGPRY